MADRKRLLVNFGYYRKHWIAPFEKLTDQFEIVYLFYIHKSQESLVYTEQERIFWSDFNSAGELLESVKPDRVIFMDITSGLAICLNYVSKKRGIPTYILQHGLYSEYKDYRKREKQSKASRNHRETPNTEKDFTFSTISFFKKSLGLSSTFALLKLPLFLYLLRKEGHVFASRVVRFEARKPSFYLCYTPGNAVIHHQLDGHIADRCRFIGNPELYDLDLKIRNSFNEAPLESYYLHIDQPFADNRYGEHIKSRQEMIDFYTGLADLCQKENAKLYVKLHPESYHSNWLPNHENINWIKDTDKMPLLISGSLGCFGFFSTLLLPAILHKPTILFRVGESTLYEKMNELKSAQVLGFDELEKVDLNKKDYRPEESFINHYFYQKEMSPILVLGNVLKDARPKTHLH